MASMVLVQSPDYMAQVLARMAPIPAAALMGSMVLVELMASMVIVPMDMVFGVKVPATLAFMLAAPILMVGMLSAQIVMGLMPTRLTVILVYMPLPEIAQVMAHTATEALLAF